jgi:hypothetical protein
MLELHPGNRLIDLVEHYEKIGSSHEVPRLAAVAWTQAAKLRLSQMHDSQAAYVAAGRALKLDAGCAEALEMRAEAGALSGREKEAIEALQRRMALPATDEQRASRNKLLGRLFVALGDPAQALPLLGADPLAELDLPSLAKGGAALAALQGPQTAVEVYRRLTEGYRPDEMEALPGDERKPTATRAQLTEWNFALAQACEATGDHEAALQAFRRTVALDSHHRGALAKVAVLSAENAPEEAAHAHLMLAQLDVLEPQSMHQVFALLRKLGKSEQAFCVAAALVGLGLADDAEKAAYEAEMQKPLPAELPRLADGAVDRAPILAAGDEGPARELLAMVSAELAQVLPPDLAGKADRVKGDNPVRRVCNALSRALGAAEPQLFVARAQPSVVAPVSSEPPGLLVGAEVPRRFPARQQRFLYGRALAHIRRGTAALAALPGARLGQLIADLLRFVAPPGADTNALAALPPSDAELANRLTEALSPVAELGEDADVHAVDPRQRLGPAAARLLADPLPSWDALALALRETAERAAMVICGDPGAAIAVVAGECGGGLDKPEVAQLVRFALSEEYAALRAR